MSYFCPFSAFLLFSLLAGAATGEERAARQLFWGDTHVHTNFSLDAQLFGNTRLGPDAAYRFARGEAVDTGEGRIAQLSRPLDFLMISDHAEYLGVFRMIRADHPLVAQSAQAAKIKAVMADDSVAGPEHITRLNKLLGDDQSLGQDLTIQRTNWHEMIDIAERMNTPGRFTTFVGYEWGTTPDGNNLHRNVIFRDGPDRTKTILPFSAMHSNHPEELWAFLADYERKTGGQAFAIPHNSNLSNGLMFALEDSEGKPFDGAYARARASFEPIVEVTQIKGDSETHPFLSPDDEFADFETWDATNIFGLAKTESSMLAGNYARRALANGLAIEHRTGTNPYRFGLIGSTDAHTSLATADDDNYWGKTSRMLRGMPRSEGVFIHSTVSGARDTLNWEQAAAGYAAVWAGENTREDIFDALRRREAYATTGPRVSVRFFGGWEYSEDDAHVSDLAAVGYAKGVPMGGVLPARGEGASAPRFLVAAAQDPEGARLERVQLVKGWLDASGTPQEKVFDVAMAKDPKLGAAQLIELFTDPEFAPGAEAFYYVRVLQIETPRWTQYDAKEIGGDVPEGTRLVHRERAYTSPIWYSPKK